MDQWDAGYQGQLTSLIDRVIREQEVRVASCDTTSARYRHSAADLPVRPHVGGGVGVGGGGGVGVTPATVHAQTRHTPRVTPDDEGCAGAPAFQRATAAPLKVSRHVKSYYSAQQQRRASGGAAATAACGGATSPPAGPAPFPTTAEGKENEVPLPVERALLHEKRRRDREVHARSTERAERERIRGLVVQNKALYREASAGRVSSSSSATTTSSMAASQRAAAAAPQRAARRPHEPFSPVQGFDELTAAGNGQSLEDILVTPFSLDKGRDVPYHRVVAAQAAAARHGGAAQRAGVGRGGQGRQRAGGVAAAVEEEEEEQEPAWLRTQPSGGGGLGLSKQAPQQPSRPQQLSRPDISDLPVPPWLRR